MYVNDAEIDHIYIVLPCKSNPRGPYDGSQVHCSREVECHCHGGVIHPLKIVLWHDGAMLFNTKQWEDFISIYRPDSAPLPRELNAKRKTNKIHHKN